MEIPHPAWLELRGYGHRDQRAYHVRECTNPLKPWDIREGDCPRCAVGFRLRRVARMIDHTTGRRVVLFDGLCNLCSRAVQFIIRRDEQGIFCFAPLQSEVAAQLSAHYQFDTLTIDTLILIKDGQVFSRSDAVLEIASELDGGWRHLSALRRVPRGLRDSVYRLFGRLRYPLFGRRDRCVALPPGRALSFVDVVARGDCAAKRR
jgi:predicted DCC family thiol-disulfide oxidoreductase YuxK